VQTFEATLASGNAPEHTHRSTLIALVESLGGDVKAVDRQD